MVADQSSPPPSREIPTTYGPVVGLRLINEGDRSVDAFLGIPYAAPPVANLRFKKPEPHEGWTEPRQCTKFGFRAIQKEAPIAKPGATASSEDCLTLNIFSPTWEPESGGGFAVLIYIHGGNLLSGGSSQLGDLNLCEHLCKKDVLVVTIQYRLGYLGFWDIGEGSCRGNLGLWDLAFALKWLRQNLRHFNGNPENITVMGQSSGALVADILALSPQTRDMVHKVISMAGTADCEWVFRKSHQAFCRKFAEEQGIDLSEDPETILDKLREIPAEMFALSLYEVPPGKYSSLGMVVDGDFLPGTTEELRKDMDSKPYLIGLPSSDGMMRGRNACSSIEDVKKVTGTMFPDVPSSVKEEYVQKIQDLIDSGKNLQWSIIQAHTDSSNGIGNYTTAMEMLAKGADVFLYRMNYCNPSSYDRFPFPCPIRDATHCHDISYVLGRPVGLPFEYNEDDKWMLNLMSTLWTNFAKYGDPNGKGESPLGKEKWLPLTKNEPERHLCIELTPKMDNPFFDGRPRWCWEQLKKYKKH